MKRYNQNLNAGGVQPLNYALPPKMEVEIGPIVQETSLVGTNIFLTSMIVGGRVKDIEIEIGSPNRIKTL